MAISKYLEMAFSASWCFLLLSASPSFYLLIAHISALKTTTEFNRNPVGQALTIYIKDPDCRLFQELSRTKQTL